MDENLHRTQPLFSGASEINVHFPTNGRVCDPLGVDAREIISANLRALMDYSQETGHPELASYLGISTLSGIARPTVREMVEGVRNVRVDSLEAVAKAFGVQAWTLLIPDLDPSNPPVKPSTRTEIQLYKRLAKVGREYDLLMRQQSEKAAPVRRASDANHDHPRRIGSGTRDGLPPVED